MALNIKTSGNTLATTPELEYRISREGTPWGSSLGGAVRWNGDRSSGGQSIGGPSGIALPVTNKGIYIKNIKIMASQPVVIRTNAPRLINLNTSAVGNTYFQFGDLVIEGEREFGAGWFLNPLLTRPTLNIIRVINQDPMMINAVVSSGLSSNKNGNLDANNVNLGNGTYSYVLNVVNNTGSSTSGTVTVTDRIPTDARFVSAAGTGWTINETDGVLTATTPYVFNNGANKSLTVILAPKSNVEIQMYLDGWQVDLDFNYNAPAVVWNGTSITYGSGITDFTKSYTYLLRNYLRDVRGVENRVINRGIPGASTSIQEYRRTWANQFDLPDIPLCAFIEHGVNDITQSIPSSTTVSNIKAYIKHWRNKSKNVPIIILAPFPNGNATTESALSILSTLISTEIESIRQTDTNVWFVSGTRTVINPVTQLAAYMPDGTHFNDAGQALVAQVISSFIADNDIM